ncbi:C4-dicarboxylate transporter DcuC [Mycoplasmatota bacterium]|nr:C4-dicarboxylate transporter DcuC [Mycoplasmatota bacterium]
MEQFIMWSAAFIAVALVVYMLLIKADIKMTLLGVGLALLYVATILLGNSVAETGNAILDPFQVVVDQFKKILPKAGLIILILGGYSSYMSAIGANEVTVDVLTKPLKGIKSAYVLVPFVFLLGNLLSLVVPSASNLAIILLATLYPVLKKSGMSTLTAAAVIATTATVMPTPLGGDNVAIAEELSQYSDFTGLTASEYVFSYHALVSIPTLILMAVVHYFWQKYQDKKLIAKGIQIEEDVTIDTTKAVEIQGGVLYKTVYALLPIFPIILLLVFYILGTSNVVNVNLSVGLSVLVSFLVAIIAELIRRRFNGKEVFKHTETFFKGMGNGFGIVALLVAASVFVSGLKGIGIVDAIREIMQNNQGQGFVLPLILVLFTALIVILSGSGTALFYSMVPLMYPLAAAAGISALAVTIPMGLAGNLLRAVSPVSAVVVIVAGTTKQNPFNIVKRTSVPMISGVIFMFILSMIMFL